MLIHHSGRPPRKRLTASLAAVSLAVVGAGLSPHTFGGPITARACLVSVSGICAVPPPVPAGLGSQTSVGDVGSVGTTEITTCPQVMSGTATTTSCSSGGRTASLNCTIRTEETPQNGTIYAQSQTTCNEDVSLTFSYGWDSENFSGGPVNLAAGQEYQVNETYGGSQNGCHAWGIGIGATDSAGNYVTPSASVAYCF